MKTLLFLLLTLNISASAQDDTALRRKEFNLEDGLAIQGFDPISYFSLGKGTKGKKEFRLTYKGASYYFTSANNRDKFRQTPEKYEPQYGGWCAYAMGANAEKVEIDPETFKIVGGKLFLFYNAYFNNTLKKWNMDEVKLKNKADINWGKAFQ
jgi:YHS domain-containing protein